ncbi:MAG TPA: Wzz/FepE/Etk N-terminal domain-containing protein [bacterium]|nr:Wzz/FepE/Etk N-terminal domain-containing protein [bacterium]HQP99264.1 Wzz/FepE/Etk N-terminal domain-containing protein [bacterium]
MNVEREIDLASVYRVVWERGKRILIVTFVVMVFSYLATLSMTKRYGAMAEVEVRPSHVGEHAMQNWPIPIEAQARYIEGDDTLKAVIDELKLAEEPFEIKKVDQLASRISVSKYKETSIIRVYAEMETSEMAAKVANKLAQKGIEKNLAFLVQEASRTAQLLDETLSARMIANASRETNYLLAQKQYELEKLQKYLDNLYSQWQLRMSERENLLISDRELTARVASLEEAIQHQPEKIYLTRALSEEAVLLEMIRSATPDVKGSRLPDLSLTIESPNPEHYALVAEKDRLEAQLKGDQAKLAQIEATLPGLENQVRETQNKFYDANMEVARLKAEYDRSYEIFGGIDKELGWAFTTIFSERYEMIQVNQALAKDAVASPNRPAVVVLSGSLAFLMALAYFLLKDLYGIAQKKESVSA